MRNLYFPKDCHASNLLTVFQTSCQGASKVYSRVSFSVVGFPVLAIASLALIGTRPVLFLANTTKFSHGEC